jgi:hypothetical protein
MSFSLAMEPILKGAARAKKRQPRNIKTPRPVTPRRFTLFKKTPGAFLRPAAFVRLVQNPAWFSANLRLTYKPCKILRNLPFSGEA